MHRTLPPIFLLLASMFVGCQPKESFAVVANVAQLGQAKSHTSPLAIGLNYVTTSRGGGKPAYNRLIDKLDELPPVGIVAEIDHAANAESVGLELPYTKVVLFGNPTLGTPLMQKNQRAGLDLPQKMLVYKADKRTEYVAYNNTTYLGSRHDVADVPTLDKIAGALQNIATFAGKDAVTVAEEQTVAYDAGIIEKITTAATVDQVYTKLRSIVEGNPNVSVLAELDHQANAARVGLDLRPTRLIVIGNPALGTPLMQSGRSIAIDLPQKILVYEAEDGTTTLIYNDPFFLADRHGLPNDLPELLSIANALDNLTSAALE